MTSRKGLLPPRPTDETANPTRLEVAAMPRSRNRKVPNDPISGHSARRDDARGSSQADILIRITNDAQLFRAPDSIAYADVLVRGHRETLAIRAKGFRLWLCHRFFKATGGAPSAETLEAALKTLEAKALFDSPERTVHVRVGELGGKLYLDLGDESWRVVEVDATGWRVVGNSPVRFCRAPGMRPLPAPIRGGSIEVLRTYLNVQTDDDFVMVVMWLLAALRDRGPYPLLVLMGEQGSGKSMAAAMLRALVDPNIAPLRSLPRQEHDLFIAANNSHILAFDNMSGIHPAMSDALCRVATGGAFATRRLYSDGDEVMFDVSRPLILNGIGDIVRRPDLADRAVFVGLEPIPEEGRRPEAELWKAFEVERPRLLGALLDGVVEGLRRLPDTHIPMLPRMADFAQWGTACETAFWPAGTFSNAYTTNRAEAALDVIDADPIAEAVIAFMRTRPTWSGTATELLAALSGKAEGQSVNDSLWSKDARSLSSTLRRLATPLRGFGIEINFALEGRLRRRMIHIKATRTEPAP